MDKIIVLDCKVEGIKNPHKPNNSVNHWIFNEAKKAVLSHAHPIDIDKAEEMLIKKLCKRNGWEPADIQYDTAVQDVRWFLKTFSQFLESQIKTDTEKKR